MSPRLFAFLFLLWLIFWAIAVPLMIASAARAHGDAEWIMRDPRYTDNVGIHCCGPSDCGPVGDKEVTDDNVSASYGGQSLMKRERGVYWSIDDRPWVCKRNGRVKCIFLPQPGS